MIDEDVTASVPDEVISKNDMSAAKHEYSSAENERHVPERRRSNPKKTIALIVGGCVLILLCCCCASLFLSSQGIISDETIASMCATIKEENPEADTFGLCDEPQPVEPGTIEE